MNSWRPSPLSLQIYEKYSVLPNFFVKRCLFFLKLVRIVGLCFLHQQEINAVDALQRKEFKDGDSNGRMNEFLPTKNL